MKTHPVYLNGDWLVMPESVPIRNPATDEVIARMSVVDRGLVAQAIRDAHAAFVGWRQLTAKARGEFLHQLAQELERRRNDIARLITLENGKPLAQSQGEVAMTADHLRWFAEEGRRGYGRIIPHQTDGKRNLVIKTPIGVVAAISPWNFPLVLSVRKIAPALAAGCPVILKPASHTPLCNVAFAEACAAVKVPKACSNWSPAGLPRFLRSFSRILWFGRSRSRVRLKSGSGSSRARRRR
jgi:succinate-semialdehyde dehydrogenase/glutarate-semialdehyde dehydrogenase